jgi:chemotaxis protein MotB
MSKGRRHKGHAAEHENAERWLLTYADLITLLMVFFVVLYSMSSADSTKFKRMSAALQQAFNVDVLQGQTQSSIGDGDPAPAVSADTTAISDAQVPQVARLQGAISAVLDGVPQAPDVTVTVDREGIVIRLSGSYLFDSGRAELKPNSLAVLDTIADQLKLIDNEIRVDGHTDSTPIESSRYPTNWELSTARALAVTRYLSESDGVQATRLMAAGFGEFRPLYVNDTRDHRAMNRRVEIHLLSSTLADPAAPPPISQTSASQPQGTTEHMEP